MPDREKVIGDLEGLTWDDLHEWHSDSEVRQIAKDAIELLKEQEVLLKRAYELLADMDLDFFCEDLICNDGWCDDHCTTNGTTPECIERWLRKQIEEGL